MELNEVLALVKEYLKISKDLSMLLEGTGSFIHNYNAKTHRIHGKVDTLGAVTGRCTHHSPNITQAPKSKEFRELLCVPDNKVLLDVDAGALELVTMGHYLGKFDDYEFAKAVDSGDKSKGTDIHSVNQRKAGLATRDQAKTLIYATVYGAGTTKLGAMLWQEGQELDYTEQEYKEAKEAVEKRIVELNGKKFYPVAKGTLTPYTEELILKTIFGTRVAKMFKDNTKGYYDMTTWAVNSVKDNHIIALDGRRLYLRSAHKALNLYLQSAGAIYMKHLLCHIDKQLRAKYTHGKEFGYVANIHDALNIECDPEVADDICKILSQSFIDTSYKLGMKYPVYGEPKIGKNQYETH